jgi:hypothetical protein
MKQDKFLLGILIFIGLLVAAALIVFFVRQPATTYQPDDTPQGVVFNFILALQQKDYARAYAYLVEAPGKPSLMTFERFYQNNVDLSTLAVDFGETRLQGERASVEMTITHIAANPFSSEWREAGAAFLVRQGGLWKIESLPWQFWGWDWYQP